MAATRFDLVGPYAIEKGFPWELFFTRLQPEAPPLRFSTASGHVVLGGPAGTVAIRLGDADTRSISAAHSLYRLVFTDAIGIADLYFRGRVSYLEGAE